VVGQPDRVAGGVDERDKPALGIVLSADPHAAECVDHLVEIVRPGRVVDQARDVAGAVSDAYQIAVTIVLIADTLAGRADDAHDSALRVAVEGRAAAGWAVHAGFA